MEQLSRPYQIALGALLVLAAAWFTVLKPSSSESAPPPPPTATSAAKLPGQQGLQNAVTKAKGAVTTSATSAAATLGAAEATSGTASPAASRAVRAATPVTAAAAPTPAAAVPATASSSSAAAPAAAPADASAGILRELGAGKVAVLLFFSPGGYEDASVRHALHTVDRHHGKVTVHAAPIGRVARYAAITEGVDVLQSPTVLVIGADRRARSIVGFTDTRSVDQLVADVGGPAFRSHPVMGYAARIRSLCAVVRPSLSGDAFRGPDFQERLSLARRELVDLQRDRHALTVPAPYRTFDAALKANLRLSIDALAAIAAAVDAHRDAVAVYAPLKTPLARSNARVVDAGRRAGVTGC